jgi:ammonium transporter, Amt family
MRAALVKNATRARWFFRPTMGQPCPTLFPGGPLGKINLPESPNRVTHSADTGGGEPGGSCWHAACLELDPANRSVPDVRNPVGPATQNTPQSMMRNTPTFKRWALALNAAAVLGLGLISVPHARAQEDPAPPPAAAAAAGSDMARLEAILKKANEYVAAQEAAGDDESKAPDWNAFVSEDADTVWTLISDLAGGDETGDATKDLLNSQSAEVNQAIYDNVWANASALTPWLTHNIWVLIAAFLVFIMHLGFATLESGLCQTKNAVNILFKNCWIIASGLLLYFLWGFNAHYPGWETGFFAVGGPAEYPATELLTHSTNLYHASYTWWTDFIFQAMFAATAATIVSGAVAERVKLNSFLIFSVLLVGIAYPWAGSWHWGGGILADLKTGAFYDFAGSTVVHAFGGFAALACVIVLGPRAGKYLPDGKIRPIIGHSMPLATIGVFLLFLGWFGFNGGSVLAAEPHKVSLVFVTTALAAVSGAIASMFTGWILLKKPDLSMTLNGFLAGLVGITAGADAISPTWSIVVGLIAGALVVVSILVLDRIKIDDPVGAISVHGVCGIWGTLAVAFFGGASLVSQLIGIAAVCAFAFVFSYVVFLLLKLTMGVRVSADHERKGLDVEEHGAPAYHFGADVNEMV